MSPKATIIARDHLVSSEKISVDIPVAQIIMPEARKKVDHVTNSKKSKDQMSQSKSNFSVYKLGNPNSEAQEYKGSTLDNVAKVAPFRTKKMSLERVGLNSSSQLQKYRLPMSSHKKLPNGLQTYDKSSQKPYMSNQKSNEKQ